MMALKASLTDAVFADIGRIVLGAEQDEVVVHRVEAFFGMSVGDELVFRFARMHEQHIGIALRANLDRLPGADGDDIDAAVTRLLELGQNGIEQTGVGGAGRRGEFQHLLAGRRGWLSRFCRAAVG